MMGKILLLMLLLPFAGMQAQRLGTQPRDEAAVSSQPAMRLVPATPVDHTTAGDTIEVSERELNDALREIARAVQLNELQRMVAEMAAQQQLSTPASERRYEERFDRLERLLAAMAGRMGYSPATSERRNLILLPDGSAAVPYPVYPGRGTMASGDQALQRQIELLQEQIALLDSRSPAEQHGIGVEPATGDSTRLRLQQLRVEMRRLQQEQMDRTRLLAEEERRTDSLFRSFLAEQPLTAEASASTEQPSAAALPARGAGNDAGVSAEKRSSAQEEALRSSLTALYLRQLFFPVASAELTGEGGRVLKEVASLLQTHPTLQVSLKGYASREGNRDYNRRLSQRRAAAAADYLRRLGVDTARIRVISEGVDDAPDMLTYGRRVDIGVF